MIVVTGGCGLVGQALVRRLRVAGQPVTVLDLAAPPPSFAALGVATLRVDVGDGGAVGEALRGATAVVHLAAKVSDFGTLADFEHRNVTATRIVATAARAADVARFVHMSSMAVLDYRVPRDGTTETALVGGHEYPYGITKARAERMLREEFAPAGLPVVIVRPGLFVYGPGDARASARMLAAVERGVPLLIGGGEALLSTSYVENLVAGVAQCLVHPGAVGEVFHLSDDVRMTWRTLVTRMHAALDIRRTPRSVPAAVAWPVAATLEALWASLRLPEAPPLTRYRVRTAVSDLHISNAKAKRILGFDPQVGLDEGLAATVAWYRAGAGPPAGDPWIS